MWMQGEKSSDTELLEEGIILQVAGHWDDHFPCLRVAAVAEVRQVVDLVAWKWICQQQVRIRFKQPTTLSHCPNSITACNSLKCVHIINCTFLASHQVVWSQTSLVVTRKLSTGSYMSF